MSNVRTVSHRRIDTVAIGGAGNGNSYNYEVTRELDNGDEAGGLFPITTLAHGERDVASAYEYAGLPIPAELAGPYDCYGRNGRAL